MKNKKVLGYVGIGVVVLLVLIGVIGSMGVVVEDAGSEEYRSDDVPLDCQLPVGEDVESWKEHLSHHGNTLYCLEYFE